MEEPGEQYEVAQIHRQAELNVHPADVAVDLTSLKVLVRGDVYRAADYHLR